MTKQPHFTRTERRIMELLSDGEPHTKVELQACLEDDLAKVESIRAHIKNIRQKLHGSGTLLLCELRQRRKICYRMTVHVHSAVVRRPHISPGYSS